MPPKSLSSFPPGGHYLMKLMTDDAQLLRAYVESHSESAFAELVQRHHAFVYHAALRQLGNDRHLAADVVQGVFILLAEKSPGLLLHPSLAGWLHTATHFKVGHALRAERRRYFREQVALAMSDPAHESAAKWEHVRPVLDRALLELNASDREAVLLRFFENRAFADIAAHLRLTEAAAHKRVERALEKLRERLTRHGVTSTAAALGAWLGTQGALAAPAGLAASVTGAVVASGLPVAATVGGLAFMSMKTTVSVAALVVIFTAGVATYEVRTAEAARVELGRAEREVASVQASLRAEEDRIARERAAAAAVAAAPVATPPPPATAPRPAANDRSQLALAERIAAGRAFLKAHPEVKAAYAANLQRKIREENADLLRAMRLSEEETERFLAVLMNGRRSLFNVGPEETLIFSLLDEDWPPGEFARQLKDVLGDERYRQYQDFQRSGTALSIAKDLVGSLYYTSTPLTPLQIEQFKQVMMELLADRRLGPAYTGPSMHIPIPVWTELMKRSGALLSAPQLEALADVQQQSLFFHAQAAARRAYDQAK